MSAYVRTEKVGMSPAEKSARLKRLGRDLVQSVSIEDLRSRGFSYHEIDTARRVWKVGPPVHRRAQFGRQAP